VAEPTRYDRDVSSEVSGLPPGDPAAAAEAERRRQRRRLLRLVVVPLILLACGWGATFALAKLHLAKPGTPKAATGSVALGDPYRGEVTFGQTCAPCHGPGGTGGIGPRLKGDAVTIARVKAQIDGGGGTMPARLVSGKVEQDVLAYVATLIAAPKS
jgi:mono/diheme cytochrome c family protein